MKNISSIDINLTEAATRVGNEKLLLQQSLTVKKAYAIGEKRELHMNKR